MPNSVPLHGGKPRTVQEYARPPVAKKEEKGYSSGCSVQTWGAKRPGTVPTAKRAPPPEPMTSALRQVQDRRPVGIRVPLAGVDKRPWPPPEESRYLGARRIVLLSIGPPE